MKYNIFDWIKLVLVVLSGIVWIIISKFGLIGQLAGCVCYIACMVNWLCSGQGKDFTSKLL